MQMIRQGGEQETDPVRMATTRFERMYGAKRPPDGKPASVY